MPVNTQASSFTIIGGEPQIHYEPAAIAERGNFSPLLALSLSLFAMVEGDDGDRVDEAARGGNGGVLKGDGRGTNSFWRLIL